MNQFNIICKARNLLNMIKDLRSVYGDNAKIVDIIDNIAYDDNNEMTGVTK